MLFVLVIGGSSSNFIWIAEVGVFFLGSRLVCGLGFKVWGLGGFFSFFFFGLKFWGSRRDDR